MTAGRQIVRDPDLDKGLSRIEGRDGHRDGWLARVQWRKKSYGSSFADDDYGGDPERSRRAARRYVRETERSLGKPHRPSTVQSTALGSTGIVGVSWLARRNAALARITVRGETAHLWVSAAVIGKQRAIAEAASWRSDEERRLARDTA